MKYKLSLIMFLMSIVLTIVTFNGPQANAGRFIDFCYRILGGSPELRKIKKFKRDSNRELSAFIRARKKDNKVAPPTDPYVSSTSDIDLIFGIHFWWYPGNVYHSMMMSDPHYSLMSTEMIEQMQKAGVQLPKAEDLLVSIDGAVDIDNAGIPDSIDAVVDSHDTGVGDSNTYNDDSHGSADNYDSESSYDSDSSSFD